MAENTEQMANQANSSGPPPPGHNQLYEEPHLQGVVTEASEPAIPVNLAYVDFLPRCVAVGGPDKEPTFDSFDNLMQGVNAWLKDNSTHKVMRCEILIRRWTNNMGALESETTIYRQPVYGNIGYVRGIRVWLTPHPEPKGEVQQIGYLDLTPESEQRVDNRVKVGAPLTNTAQEMKYKFPKYKSVDDILEKFNRRLALKPVPGKILSIETYDLKYKLGFEPTMLNPNVTSWVETGGSPLFYVTVLKIFYLQNEKEDIAEIGLMDFIPKVTDKAKLHASFQMPKFAKFTPTSVEAAKWVHQQEQIRALRVTNIQTINAKFSHAVEFMDIDSRKSYHSNHGQEYTFLQVTRVGYVIPSSFDDTIRFNEKQIALRGFLPMRVSVHDAETIGQTVQRINDWLNATGVRVLGAETLRFEYNASVKQTDTEKANLSIFKRHEHHWIAFIRVYLDGAFREPPPTALLPLPPYEHQKINKPSSTCTVL